MLDQIDAFFSLLERFKRYSSEKTEPDSVANRFVRLFEKHSVHRNQIPRFFGHGLTLADVVDDDKLLIKLTPEILHAAADLFAVRLEWLEGVDNKIYETHDFYKCPGAYAEFIAQLIAGCDYQVFAELLLSTDPYCQEDALLILAETFAENGNESVKRYHLCSNWFSKYWKSRAGLTACIALTAKRPISLKGQKTPANIERFCAGEGFIADLDGWPPAFERKWPSRKRFKVWHPDDWLYDPKSYLDGVAEGEFGKASALAEWLYYFDQGYMETGYRRENAKAAFTAALNKYKKVG